MNRRQWLEGLLLSHGALREFRRWARDGGAQGEALRAALSARGSRAERSRRIDDCLRLSAAKAIQVVTPADDEYPALWIESLFDFPPALFLRGDAALLRRADAVAVVGARKASPDGLAWAERCGRDLARSGHPVVSGLAYGIDAASHRGCLAGGGAPVAVVGTGLDQVYPPEHAALQAEVATAGCLLSELPPGLGARPWNFVARNRLIAGLGCGLVVVEAGARSGTLSTVGFAQQQGKDVVVVPGLPSRPQHAGTLALAREGAPIVRHARDVMEEFRLDPGDESREEHLPGGLLGPARVEEISRAAGVDVHSMLARLSLLEIEGKVRRLEGGYYLPVAPDDQSR